MNALKPVIKSTDTAAMRALQQWDNYRVLPTTTGWAVLNKKTGDSYSVSVDGTCNCPQARRVNPAGEVCKHYSRACLEERMKTMVDAPAAQLTEAEKDAAAAARRAKFFAPD